MESLIGCLEKTKILDSQEYELLIFSQKNSLNMLSTREYILSAKERYTRYLINIDFTNDSLINEGNQIYIKDAVRNFMDKKNISFKDLAMEVVYIDSMFIKELEDEHYCR